MKTWFSRASNKRGIYAPVLVHIYDTSTDIGVIILWAQYAYREKKGKIDIEHVDMMNMFILACVLICWFI